MSIPLTVLLAFCAWTLLLLVATIGYHRWSLVASGRANLVDFPSETPHGPPRYRRAQRAHANCLENLPIFGAIVLATIATGVRAPILDVLAIVFIGARVVQTSVHVIPEPTNAWVGVRFAFFALQVTCTVWMGVYVVVHA